MLMPWLRAGTGAATDVYYAWLGAGGSVLVAPFVVGDRIVAALTRPDPWFVVAGMVASTVALPLLRPGWLLLVAPPLAASLLSAHPPQADLWLQYPLLLLVPLLVATGMGGRRLLATVTRRWRHRSRTLRGRLPASTLGLLALPAIAGAWVQGSLPPFSPQDPAFAPRPAAMEQLRAFARIVPEDAVIVTDEGLVAPLAGRPDVRRLTRVSIVPPGAYAILDRDAWVPGPRSGARRQQMATWVESRRRQLADDGRFRLFGPRPASDAP
jgi:hypothetical protein